MNEKFQSLWSDLERAMRRSIAGVGGQQVAQRLEGEQLIAALYQHRKIDRDARETLDDLRKLRNVIAHPKSGTASRGLFTITEEGLAAADGILNSLTNPPTAAALLRPAQSCTPADMVTGVIGRMHDNDFDMIPYREGSEWLVFSRTHVALWVEAAAADPEDSDIDHIMLERLSVGQLVAKVAAPMRPAKLSSGTPLYKAVEQLEDAIRAHAAGATSSVAPMLLSDEGGKAKVATPWDLPRAADLMKPVRAKS
jgi:hypothetical protein